MLSKSRLLASLQCPKRVHLEVHHPEWRQYSKKTEAAFALGHDIGALARRLYGTPDSAFIEYSAGSLAPALKATETLMTSLFAAPVFEATLEAGGVLVREDVLLPMGTGPAHSWRIVEVKASTKLKPEHLHDCAVQAWVHREAGYPLAGIALAHIDSTFIYQGDGRYDGLLVEQDVTERVFDLMPSVPIWIGEARAAVEGEMPEVPVGQHCTKPYECPFLHRCWPNDTPYPIAGLGGGRRKLGEFVARGYRDIRDVPASEISGEVQLRIHRVTKAGVPELLPGARAFVERLAFPRFYLDFETFSPAVPIFPGTRPYETLPFQWSCHVERAPGVFEHREFLDLSGEPPMRRLAEALLAVLETAGPVLMYTDYERGVIEGLAARFPDLAAKLAATDVRLVDLHPVTRANYYHPDMLGSWSLKAVLPTIAPDLDYAALGGIREGTEASAAYREAIAPATTAARRDELRQQLLRYCRLDTEGMVRLVQFFSGQRPASRPAH